jgi:rare lipoprotein A
LLAVAVLPVLSGCASGPEASAPLAPTLTCTETAAYREEGVASWYGRSHHGKPTASGERFDMGALTAAHRRLPLGTRVKVTNLRNSREATLRINDRGPYARGRILDVSHKGAEQLGFVDSGTARVRIETLSSC